MLSLDDANPAVGHIMCFYDVGNHGGGPMKGNNEYILNNGTAFKDAELVFRTPQRFFQEVAKVREKLCNVQFERRFPAATW